MSDHSRLRENAAATARQNQAALLNAGVTPVEYIPGALMAGHERGWDKIEEWGRKVTPQDGHKVLKAAVRIAGAPGAVLDGVGAYRAHKEGRLGEYGAKWASGKAGAFVGGAIGTVGGPAGTIAGAAVGNAVGEWVYDNRGRIVRRAREVRELAPRKAAEVLTRGWGSPTTDARARAMILGPSR